jgi:hypothetical protein
MTSAKKGLSEPCWVGKVVNDSESGGLLSQDDCLGMSIDYKSKSLIHRNIKWIRNLDFTPQKVYSMAYSHTVRSYFQLSG